MAISQYTTVLNLTYLCKPKSTLILKIDGKIFVLTYAINLFNINVLSIIKKTIKKFFTFVLMLAIVGLSLALGAGVQADNEPQMPYCHYASHEGDFVLPPYSEYRDLCLSTGGSIHYGPQSTCRRPHDAKDTYAYGVLWTCNGGIIQ